MNLPMPFLLSIVQVFTSRACHLIASDARPNVVFLAVDEMNHNWRSIHHDDKNQSRYDIQKDPNEWTNRAFEK